MFYNGLDANNYLMLDTSIGGALINKTPKVAYGLLKELVSSNY